MVYLEKYLELAEDYTLKNQRYARILNNRNKSIDDLKKAEKEKEEARQKYISFITKFSKVKLSEEVKE